MPSPTVEELMKTAEEAARRSGRVLKDLFTQARTISFKRTGIDLVTDADKASEKELIPFLQSRYPDHAILSEESGLTPGRPQGLRWICDPLDGTTNYAHQVPHFCVSIAVDGPEGLIAGAIYDPIRDELFAAGKGKGASLNGKPIKPSPAATLGEALLCTGFPYDVREKPEAPVGLFTHFVKQAQGVRRMGSAALDISYVASGRFDGFFEFGLKPWDIAAAALLMEEAGGVIRQIDGQPLDLNVGDVLACNAALAPTLAGQCGKFLKDIGWTPRRST